MCDETLCYYYLLFDRGIICDTFERLMIPINILYMCAVVFI